MFTFISMYDDPIDSERTPMMILNHQKNHLHVFKLDSGFEVKLFRNNMNFESFNMKSFRPLDNVVNNINNEDQLKKSIREVLANNKF